MKRSRYVKPPKGHYLDLKRGSILRTPKEVFLTDYEDDGTKVVHKWNHATCRFDVISKEPPIEPEILRQMFKKA